MSMIWNRRFLPPQMEIAPTSWEVLERKVSEERDGSQRATLQYVDSEEINKRQLDPRIVTLESLLNDGITIEPGNIAHMFDLTDPASIEEFNTLYTHKAYEFLKAHKDEIFKSV